MEIRGEIEVFPTEVQDLLRGLAKKDFFVDGILCGSWAMLVYRQYNKLTYTLRTDDIDFALEMTRSCVTDIPAILGELGYLPLIDADGLEKFVKDTFSIEFLVHRKGGKDVPYVNVKKMQIRAQALPFISILYHDPVKVDYGDFSIRIPSLESYFLHKLIVAQRRKQLSKAEKDLDQCESLIPAIRVKRLLDIAAEYRFSRNTKADIVKSTTCIGYPQFLRKNQN
jgi:hypothetical protein